MEWFIFALILWYASGVASFVYWWTNEYDLELTNVFMSLFVGIAGPIAFIAGWLIHGDPSPNSGKRVLMKRRK